MAGLRQLSLGDLEDGLRLSTAAGWNQTAADWARVLTLPSVTTWGIEREGRIVATTTAIRYGDSLAWIGMVLTAESHRGQGLASELMATALEALSGCRTVKLDATDQGAPLYRRFGFADEREVIRYRGRPGGEPSREPGELGGEPGPDAFPADRGALLASLGTPACLTDGSFAYGRQGRLLPFFGPCVGDGERLMRWYAGKQEGEFLMDRMGEAPEGFQPLRRLMRMYRGRPVATDAREFAFAGFEFG